MAFWLHIAEVAALIALAYTVGCLVGVVAHRLVLGLGRRSAVPVPETVATVIATAPAEVAATAPPPLEASAVSAPVVATPDIAPLLPPAEADPAETRVKPEPVIAAAIASPSASDADDRPLIRWYDVPVAPVAPMPLREEGPVAVIAPEPAAADPFVTALAALGAPQPAPSPVEPTPVAPAAPAVDIPAVAPALPIPGAAQAALAAESLLAALEAVAPPATRETSDVDLVVASDRTPPESSAASAVVATESPPEPRPMAAETPVAIDERIVAAVIAAARELQSAPPADVIEPEPPMVAPPPAAARLVDDVPVAKPAKTPGLAWSGMIKGRTSTAFVRRLPLKEKPPAPAVTPSPPSPVIAAPPAAEVKASLAASVAAGLAAPEPESTPAPRLLSLEQDSIASAASTAIDPGQPLADRPPVADSALTAALFETIATELAVDPNAPPPPRREPPKPVQPAPAAAEAITPAPPQVEPEPLPLEPAPIAVDEDDAMHAIEGGWSRRETRAMSGAPELSDVGAAVAAAQIAVETVLARSGIDPARSSDLGKPRGLPRPRNGKRDNLQTIRGLGQLDETALNNLGIFHLDQIVEWDQRAILWLENHAFARGRIAREDWQGQARALIGDASDIRVTR